MCNAYTRVEFCALTPSLPNEMDYKGAQLHILVKGDSIHYHIHASEVEENQNYMRYERLSRRLGSKFSLIGN